MKYVDEDGDEVLVSGDAALSETVDQARARGENFVRLSAKFTSGGSGNGDGSAGAMAGAAPPQTPRERIVEAVTTPNALMIGGATAAALAVAGIVFMRRNRFGVCAGVAYERARHCDADFCGRFFFFPFLRAENTCVGNNANYTHVNPTTTAKGKGHRYTETQIRLPRRPYVGRAYARAGLYARTYAHAPEQPGAYSHHLWPNPGFSATACCGSEPKKKMNTQLNFVVC